MEDESIKIGSLNVRGLGDKNKRREVFLWMKKKKYQIYFVQETHCTPEKEKLWEAEWESECKFSSYSSTKAGVAILFGNNFDYNIEENIADEEGRFLILKISTPSGSMLICNVYGPNSDSPEFYKKFFQELEPFSDIPVILGGDLNLVLDPEMDKKGGQSSSTHNKSREILLSKMDEYDLVDCFRILNPNEKRYTWHQNSPKVFCRLDFFLTSFGLLNITNITSISHGYKSDHSFITIEIGNKKLERGPGFWKLNTSLLLDTSYTQLIENTIAEKTIQYKNENLKPDTMWELIKYE